MKFLLLECIFIVLILGIDEKVKILAKSALDRTETIFKEHGFELNLLHDVIFFVSIVFNNSLHFVIVCKRHSNCVLKMIWLNLDSLYKFFELLGSRSISKITKLEISGRMVDVDARQDLHAGMQDGYMGR